MYEIVSKRVFSPIVKEIEVQAPRIAAKALAGNFVILRVSKEGERIPLTVADADPDKGTITMVFQEVGKTTMALGMLETGDSLRDLVGPLGHDRKIPDNKHIVCVAGGIGIAPIHFQAKAMHAAGNHITTIMGARNVELLFWQDRMEAISDRVLYCTDDGTFGTHGFVTDVLGGLIEAGDRIDEVDAIGPMPMMRAVCELTRPHGLYTVVSLDSLMVDGTGMCGGCRVTVGGKNKFTCVDGPEFDGHQVDFAELAARKAAYKEHEERSCRLYEAAQSE
jgi:ferredoxin--NADP+ reductase